jgi:prophage DNA circulation protein
VTWRDSLRRVTIGGRRLIGARFRGVPFFVEEAERSGGRRTATHRFPRSELPPYVEDMGKAEIPHMIEGYVIGDDYVLKRDALIAALETAGPGELVHPYYGTRRVQSGIFRVRESTRDGGLATFSLTFTETAAVPPTPTATPDHAGEVDLAADSALEAATDELAEELDADGEPAYALTSLSGEVEALAAGLQSQLGPVAATAQEKAALKVQTDSLADQAASLAKNPAALVTALGDALAALADSALDAPGSVLRALLDTVAELGLVSQAVGSTATRVKERANQDALVAGLRRVLVIEAARLAPLVAYESLDDAQLDADRIATLLQAQEESAGDSYPALVNLRARVRRAVPGDAVLARLVTIERPSTPSLVLSYQLYGTVDRESEIVARNNIAHPGAISGSLQVLSG